MTLLLILFSFEVGVVIHAGRVNPRPLPLPAAAAIPSIFFIYSLHHNTTTHKHFINTATQQPTQIFLTGEMEEDLEYWKNRALISEDAFRQIQLELRKERKERKEYENQIILKFEQFCKLYEERLLTEIKSASASSSSSSTATAAATTTIASVATITTTNQSINEGDKSVDEILLKRSNTPTPRRAAPIPPSRKNNG